MRTSGDTLAEPTIRRRLIDAAGVLTTPVLPDDYLTVVNPLWSFNELRGRIEQIIPRPGGAATIVIRPGRKWPLHRAGQHLAIGVDVDGVRHWRSYSLTSDPGRPDGCISITVKRVDGGAVSTHLVDLAHVGQIVRLGPPEGEFCMPQETAPGPLLLLTAGSGITPVIAMLRELERREQISDVVHIHSERFADDLIFGEELRGLAGRNPGVTLIERHTGTEPRLDPAELDALCPDWRQRHAYACGPQGLLDAVEAHYAASDESARLTLERFELQTLSAQAGDGGTVTAGNSGISFEAPAGTPLLVAGEEAGLLLDSGCRMGICHRCVCELRSGQVRDLRTGELHSDPGDMVQLCVSGAAGDLELAI